MPTLNQPFFYYIHLNAPIKIESNLTIADKIRLSYWYLPDVNHMVIKSITIDSDTTASVIITQQLRLSINDKHP